MYPFISTINGYTGVRVDGPANYESARKDGADFGILTPQKGVTSHFPVS